MMAPTRWRSARDGAIMGVAIAAGLVLAGQLEIGNIAVIFALVSALTIEGLVDGYKRDLDTLHGR
jgi:hypothetical protein